MSFSVPYVEVIGQRVWKNPQTTTKFSPKPFKSGLRVNTVKSLTIHPHTGKEAFTFMEDDSIVECRICSLAPEQIEEVRSMGLPQ